MREWLPSCKTQSPFVREKLPDQIRHVVLHCIDCWSRSSPCRLIALFSVTKKNVKYAENVLLNTFLDFIGSARKSQNISSSEFLKWIKNMHVAVHVMAKTRLKLKIKTSGFDKGFDFNKVAIKHNKLNIWLFSDYLLKWSSKGHLFVRLAGSPRVYEQAMEGRSCYTYKLTTLKMVEKRLFFMTEFYFFSNDLVRKGDRASWKTFLARTLLNEQGVKVFFLAGTRQYQRLALCQSLTATTYNLYR